MFAALDGELVVWSDGTTERVDTVVLATGYRPDLGYLQDLGALVDGLPLHDGGPSPLGRLRADEVKVDERSVDLCLWRGCAGI
jgi:hypothetical protein